MLAGTLMHESRRPWALDAVLFVLAVGLWAVSLGWTESAVFSAMTLGLLVLCAGASVHRRQTLKP